MAAAQFQLQIYDQILNLSFDILVQLGLIKVLNLLTLLTVSKSKSNLVTFSSRSLRISSIPLFLSSTKLFINCFF